LATRKSSDEPSARQRLTVLMRPELIERLKNAVFWVPGLTVAEAIEEGVEKTLARLEKAHGGPFPPRKAQLKRGRPVKG
jgi:hypothetical protein